MSSGEPQIMSGDRARRVAFYIPSFERGGIERFVVDLSHALVYRGVDVDVLVHDAGSRIDDLPDSVRIVRLPGNRLLGGAFSTAFPRHVAVALSSLPSYVSYMQRESPDLILAVQLGAVGVLGSRLARSDATVVVRESNTPSTATAETAHRTGRLTPLAKRLVYPRADHIVAISRGAANDVAEWLDVPRERVTVIYNPTNNDRIVARSRESIDHPWFDDDVPVVISAGRFTDQKDFTTLIRAFSRVREWRDVRLVLLGDGDNRGELEDLVADLGVGADVAFLGYVDNPYGYVARADVFVFSSRYEGLGNALIEAVAVGTPSIATDCPNGPRETLVDGEGGELVPVGDDEAMAEAIERYLDDPALAERYLAVAQEHLDRFTPATAADQYLSLLESDALGGSRP